MSNLLISDFLRNPFQDIPHHCKSLTFNPKSIFLLFLQDFWIFAEAFHPGLQYLREISITSQAGYGARPALLWVVAWFLL